MVGTSMHIGLILFPRLTQLDLTGPFEAFARIPGANVHLIWKSIDPVVSDIGLPGIDGYTVAALLWSADQDLPGLRLMALTGYSTEQDRRRSADAGLLRRWAGEGRSTPWWAVVPRRGGERPRPRQLSISGMARLNSPRHRAT